VGPCAGQLRYWIPQDCGEPRAAGATRRPVPPRAEAGASAPGHTRRPRPNDEGHAAGRPWGPPWQVPTPGARSHWSTAAAAAAHRRTGLRAGGAWLAGAGPCRRAQAGRSIAPFGGGRGVCEAATSSSGGQYGAPAHPPCPRARARPAGGGQARVGSGRSPAAARSGGARPAAMPAHAGTGAGSLRASGAARAYHAARASGPLRSLAVVTRPCAALAAAPGAPLPPGSRPRGPCPRPHSQPHSATRPFRHPHPNPLPPHPATSGGRARRTALLPGAGAGCFPPRAMASANPFDLLGTDADDAEVIAPAPAPAAPKPAAPKPAGERIRCGRPDPRL
jgi:hypothetical protein